MSEWLYHIVYPLARWLHIVSVTLLVGGTLFYELVVPKAIEELKDEQQLYIIARARWVFRWVVYVSVILLVITGAISLHRLWSAYTDHYRQALPLILGHVGLGAAGIAVALLLNVGGRPPVRPVRWMRLNLVILLVAIFLASMARHIRLSLIERDEQVTRDYRDLQKRLQQPAIAAPSTTQNTP
jgi:uncharacterized membrane protein